MALRLNLPDPHHIRKTTARLHNREQTRIRHGKRLAVTRSLSASRLVDRPLQRGSETENKSSLALHHAAGGSGSSLLRPPGLAVEAGSPILVQSSASPPDEMPTSGRAVNADGGDTSGGNGSDHKRRRSISLPTEDEATGSSRLLAADFRLFRKLEDGAADVRLQGQGPGRIADKATTTTTGEELTEDQKRVRELLDILPPSQGDNDPATLSEMADLTAGALAADTPNTKHKREADRLAKQRRRRRRRRRSTKRKRRRRKRPDERRKSVASASNNVDEDRSSSSYTYSFSFSYYSTLESSDDGQTVTLAMGSRRHSRAWIIAIAVLVALVVIAAIVVAIVFATRN